MIENNRNVDVKIISFESNELVRENSNSNMSIGTPSEHQRAKSSQENIHDSEIPSLVLSSTDSGHLDDDNVSDLVESICSDDSEMEGVGEDSNASTMDKIETSGNACVVSNQDDEFSHIDFDVEYSEFIEPGSPGDFGKLVRQQDGHSYIQISDNDFEIMSDDYFKKRELKGILDEWVGEWSNEEWLKEAVKKRTAEDKYKGTNIPEFRKHAADYIIKCFDEGSKCNEVDLTPYCLNISKVEEGSLEDKIFESLAATGAKIIWSGPMSYSPPGTSKGSLSEKLADRVKRHLDAWEGGRGGKAERRQDAVAHIVSAMRKKSDSFFQKLNKEIRLDFRGMNLSSLPDIRQIRETMAKYMPVGTIESIDIDIDDADNPNAAIRKIIEDALFQARSISSRGRE